LDIGARSYSDAKIAMSAGMVSHNNPFRRKNMTPQNPSLLIQLLRLISILLAGSLKKNFAQSMGLAETASLLKAAGKRLSVSRPIQNRER
jgi:hypothetical protein